MSPVTLVIEKLRQTPAVAEAVGIFNGKQAIVPVMLTPDFMGSGIAVNRVFDEREHHNINAVVLVTCLAASFEGVESLGEAVIGALHDGAEEWSHGDAEDVQFEKMGPDVTGWDHARQQFVRSIEFSVNW